MPFELVYEDGVERLAAGSLVERQKWINQIREAVHHLRSYAALSSSAGDADESPDAGETDSDQDQEFYASWDAHLHAVTRPLGMHTGTPTSEFSGAGRFTPTYGSYTGTGTHTANSATSTFTNTRPTGLSGAPSLSSHHSGMVEASVVDAARGLGLQGSAHNWARWMGA
ncbi:hypothetical protein C8R46DRAFT_1038439 [Mycena filopes]|nr:hypothetical protein C8R46DRAFT_1038995 [Mycena filopes]KAJ7160128.1 hypothetical protein C8R46DRAFT_1038439 [Mycena filopes]